MKISVLREKVSSSDDEHDKYMEKLSLYEEAARRVRAGQGPGKERLGLGRTSPAPNPSPSPSSLARTGAATGNPLQVGRARQLGRRTVAPQVRTGRTEIGPGNAAAFGLPLDG
jgi:hypothetical protein